MTNTNTTPQEKEWMSVTEAMSFMSVGKTWLYSQLDINGGSITTSLIRKRNARQGKRLVNVDSMRAFINEGIGVEGECNALSKSED